LKTQDAYIIKTIKQDAHTYSLPPDQEAPKFEILGAHHPRFIFRDLMKRGLLQPLEKIVEYDHILMGNKDTYCTYHQRKVHSTNSCNDLKVVILDLIA